MSVCLLTSLFVSEEGDSEWPRGTAPEARRGVLGDAGTPSMKDLCGATELGRSRRLGDALGSA